MSEQNIINNSHLDNLNIKKFIKINIERHTLETVTSHNCIIIYNTTTILYIRGNIVGK